MHARLDEWTSHNPEECRSRVNCHFGEMLAVLTEDLL